MKLTEELIVEVALWVALQTGLPIGIPVVQPLGPAELVEAIPKCRALRDRVEARGGILMFGKCPAVATYDRETRTVYVATWLPEPEMRSWLAHDFVHVGQHNAGMPDPHASCEDRREQEAQAYAVQKAYHQAHGIRWEHQPPAIRCDASGPRAGEVRRVRSASGDERERRIDAALPGMRKLKGTREPARVRDGLLPAG